MTEKEVSTMKLKHFNSITFAVFNCHDYDCVKGRRAVIAKYGNAGWKKVFDRRRTGIMEIFQHKPTRETLLYVKTIALSADARNERNERRMLKREANMGRLIKKWDKEKENGFRMRSTHKV